MAALFSCPRYSSDQPFLPRRKHYSSPSPFTLPSPALKFEMSLLVRANLGPELGAADTSSKGAAIIWYKHDLRIDDHPALVAASHHHPMLLPLYIFDHRILSRMLFSPFAQHTHTHTKYHNYNFFSSMKYCVFVAEIFPINRIC